MNRDSLLLSCFVQQCQHLRKDSDHKRCVLYELSNKHKSISKRLLNKNSLFRRAMKKQNISTRGLCTETLDSLLAFVSESGP